MPTRREKALWAEQRARKKQTRRNLLIGAGILGAVAVMAIVVIASGALNAPAPSPVAAAGSTSATCGNIQSFPEQSRDHIKPNQPHPAYSSNPPTSGSHWDTPQDWGIYTSQQVQEQLVHNLEHGGIIIQYNDLSPAEIQTLTNLVQRDSHHVVLAPYPGLSSGTKVALTAWTHLQTCTGVDENAIYAFVNAFRDKGPELVP
jgi:hypothetical protein